MGALTPTIELPLRGQSEWAGARSFTFYVRDKAGLASPMTSHAIRMVPELIQRDDRDDCRIRLGSEPNGSPARMWVAFLKMG